MNGLVTIKGTRGYVGKDGIAYLNLEDVARGLGFTQKAKSGNLVVRWTTVRRYLTEFDTIPTSWDDENSPQTGKEGLPEFIPENVVYKLCFKASNEVARAFQNLVADEILPTIRKTGGYISDSQSFIEDLDEATRKMFNVCLLMVGATNQKIDALEARFPDSQATRSSTSKSTEEHTKTQVVETQYLQEQPKKVQYITIQNFSTKYKLQWDEYICDNVEEILVDFSKRYGYPIKITSGTDGQEAGVRCFIHAALITLFLPANHGTMSRNEKLLLANVYDTKEFSNLIYTSVTSIARWDRSGKLTAYRTNKGNYRFYTHKQYLEQISLIQKENLRQEI